MSTQSFAYFTVSLLLVVGLAGLESSATAAPPIGYDWGLNLPDKPVSRRISKQMFGFRGTEPVVASEIKGPGCIRRLWVTGENIGRDVVLRIYFDGEKVPYVEAPLSDFFGVMHNLSERGQAYRINTPFFDVKPKNGMTCLLPMPFAKSARVELVGSKSPSYVYYMLDWHEYPDQKMEEPMRFCARWRRESPTVPYADHFFMLDADGPGRLVGFAYSVDMIHDRHKMRWSHAGADNIYLDGDGEHPAVLFGDGGEDTFGTSYSGGDYLPQTSLYADLPYYVQKDPKGNRQKVAGYRFFVEDSIEFQKSIYMRFSCREHDIASTVYWYSTQPVRPFAEMPPRDDRMPGTKVKRQYDLPLPDCGSWWVVGGFELDFPEAPPTNSDFSPEPRFHDKPWQQYRSKRGFVEFNDFYRHKPSNEMDTAEGVAYARAVLHAPRAMKTKLRLGWDEALTLRVNDQPAIEMGNHPYFQSRVAEVELKPGPNVVAVKLTNTAAQSRGAWSFSFRAVADDGAVLLPRAE